MSEALHDPMGVRRRLATAGGEVAYDSLEALAAGGVAPALESLPYSIRVLLAAVLRHCGRGDVTPADVERLARWDAASPSTVDVPFQPARVLLQDFTGVPLLADLAAMRAAVARLGGDPARVRPLVPVDLVVDHSVQVDHAGSSDALRLNVEAEFARNGERYRFLAWGQGAVPGFRVVPPATGIVHQVNLEYLGEVVRTGEDEGGPVAYPDTLVGTDSHTTMINGLGVLGWGVGGIEAEAAMLGQPLALTTPQVVGMRLHGQLSAGVTATDLVLTVTQILRKAGVVDKFVEFFGPGVATMSVEDRATLANMAPEYGATIGFFPVDAATLAYLRRTGRDARAVDLVERYTKAQALYRTEAAPAPTFTQTVELDLGIVVPSLAGPKRPQDREPLHGMKAAFRRALTAPAREQGFGLAAADAARTAPVDGMGARLGHGAVVIAAITSCTNTSNPAVLVAAGLVAKRAVERGLAPKPWVKTSLAPGSRAVTEYLREAGLLTYLERLGFDVVGYGCTTCIGNSGPLSQAVLRAIEEGRLVASAVLSGNRNFEGRIHAAVRANYLASPPLVVAYALAGTTDVDLTSEPVGIGRDGRPVFLAELWPTDEEVARIVRAVVRPEIFATTYAQAFRGPDEWRLIGGVTGALYPFDPASSYLQEPPFLADFQPVPGPVRPIVGARVLALLGDGVTTDHISPAGEIDEESPAGRYLASLGIPRADFNSYGARRGNDRVMVRGTFANVRLKNLMVPGVEGGVTRHLPSGELVTIHEAAERYGAAGMPLVVIAGKEYGMGSSRDWAAKGTRLLGVRAVIAESFERIHRANLVGMGVLPLVFAPGQSAETLGLTGAEVVTIEGVDARLEPRRTLLVRATRPDGGETTFPVTARLDSPTDVLYFENGGILPTVLRRLLGTPHGRA